MKWWIVYDYKIISHIQKQITIYLSWVYIKYLFLFTLQVMMNFKVIEWAIPSQIIWI